jgi:hypothetical protein
MQLSAVNAAGSLLAVVGAPDDAVQLWSWVIGHPAATMSLRTAAQRRLNALGCEPVTVPTAIELPAALDGLLKRVLPAPSIRS